MPKKLVKKAKPKTVVPVKKVKTVKAAKVAKTAKPAKTAKAAGVVQSGKTSVVGLRVRMTPTIHKQLKKKAEKEGLSQNALINKLIKESP